MQKFKIEDRSKLLTVVKTYEVEAETEAEALRLFCEEIDLEGSCNLIKSNIEPHNLSTDGKIKIISYEDQN